MNRPAFHPAFIHRSGVHRASRPLHSAFTLIELIVVIVILAVLAALIAPRLSGQVERAAENEATAVQRLLSAAAERAAMTGGRNVGIQFVRGETAGTIAMVQRDGTAWRLDPLADPVVLERLELRHAMADGRRLDPARWLIAMGGAEARPSIGLSLAPREDRGRIGYHVELQPEAMAATRRALSAAEAAAPTGAWTLPDRAVDLDATGRGDVPW
ncbi:MAG: type II secretion system protein [Phycisphaeraceae bacterium]|nr:type II secretion system protein [Phycisphaeraceae bacterium]